MHVPREKMICKYWLEPVVLSRNQGFAPKELNIIGGIIRNNIEIIKEAWDEHCGETKRSKN